MKKGVNAYCFPKSFTTDEVLENASKIGYEGVELNLDEDRLNPWKMKGSDWKTIRDKAASLSLELPSLVPWLDYNLTSPEESTRKRSIGLLKKGCEIASDLGADILLTEPALPSPQVPYRKMWELSKKGILEATKAASETSICLALENISMAQKFLCSPLEFERFVDEINHEYVKVYFDVGNCMPVGLPEHWIEILDDKIMCVHLKDFDIKKFEAKPLLQGDVDWKAVLAALKKVGYNYFLNVEVFPYPGHPIQSAIDNKSALDIILGDGL